MQFVKLQLGCLVIILYVTAGYVRQTTFKKDGTPLECNPIFDALLVFAPWTVVFDGITAWTVNHQEIVPLWLNRGAHLIFFLLMNAVIVTSFAYFFHITIGLPEKRKERFIHFIPAVISSLLIIAGVGKIVFIDGEITNYSAGLSVIVCYISIALHYGYIFILLVLHHRTIEKSKKLSVITFFALCGICLIVQAFVRESLISALYPTLMVIGLYINFENPAIVRLQKNNWEMVSAFATMVETRDGSTGGHIKRTREYVRIILHEMAKKKEYKRIITKDYRENVKNAAPLHDVGKIATPDNILMKPGKLTDEEFATMKEHAAKGGEIIEKSFSHMENPYFEKIAYEVARYHHEKWNGKGYPEGLTGEEIPLHARVMAIADVFDAVSEKRCYRDAMPLDQCFQIIKEGAGRDFDPQLVEIFLNAREKVEKKYNSVNQEIS